MKKFINVLLFFVISVSLCGNVDGNAKTTQKETYREKYCKQVKKISTDDLKKMTPEKFSYSYLDMDPIVTLKGPKYNVKTGNYDDHKLEYIKIVAKENGTLTFGGDGVYIDKAPYGMQNFQFGLYADDNSDFTDGKIIPDFYVYIGGQFCGHYLSYYNSYSFSDQYTHDKQGFSLISRSKCKDEAFSIDMKKGEAIFIGCGQNSFNFRACFMPGNSSSAVIESGNSDIVYNFGIDPYFDSDMHMGDLVSGDVDFDYEDDSATVILKYKGKTYKEVLKDYGRQFGFNPEDKLINGSKIKLTVKLKSGAKYSITRKIAGITVKRPEDLYEGSYNYKNSIISGYAISNCTVKIQYLGKTYTTKSVSSGLRSSSYSIKLPVKLKPNKKLKITFIRGDVELTGIFRI